MPIYIGVMNSLQARLDLLRRSQNPDGGWGYFPGKQSWLEPSVYASLALFGESRVERTWQLISGWQNADGAWRPAQEVFTNSWATALGVTLSAIRNESGRPLRAGASWLLRAEGAESSLTYRLSNRLHGAAPVPAVNKGWSWTTNSCSSVEPTAHAMVALKKIVEMPAPPAGGRLLSERLKLGERKLLSCKPESAAFVLLGLQGRPDLKEWIESARTLLASPQTTPLTRAWLKIALRLHGENPLSSPPSPSNDLMLIALEALSEKDGNYRLLRATGGLAA